MSLFSTLNMAVRGLHASQTAIDVTGQNISNANTEGYSRKRVSLAAGVRRDDLFGQMGMGVEVTEIRRIRDTFIDQQINEQLGGKGYYAQVDLALERLENLFKEPFDGSLNDGLNRFFNAWQDLANNPGDLAAREAVKAAAVSVTDLFHNLATETRKYRDNMDGLLVKKVAEANDLLERISELNAEISAMEAQPGVVANDSRDQRDLLVRKLSELVDVRSIEDERGNVTITSGGVLLVGPASWMKLETYTKPFTRSDGVQYSTLGVRLEQGKKELEPKAGQIRGILDIKERIIPDTEETLDNLAAGLVREVNALHRMGYSLNQTTGINFFDPAGLSAAHIRLSDAVSHDPKNIAAARGGSSLPATIVPAGGIPPQINPTYDLKGDDPRYRFLAQGSVQITLTATGELLQEGAGKDYIVDYTLGTVTFLNYNRFAGGEAVAIDFRFEQNGFPGNGDGSNALALAQLRQKATLAPDPNGNATQTFGDYYSALVGSLGIARNQNSTNLETKEFLISQMDAEQASIAGVSLDEEMTNLIRFQHSYQASARIVATVQDMMDTLMAI